MERHTALHARSMTLHFTRFKGSKNQRGVLNSFFAACLRKTHRSRQGSSSGEKKQNKKEKYEPGEQDVEKNVLRWPYSDVASVVDAVHAVRKQLIQRNGYSTRARPSL